MTYKECQTPKLVPMIAMMTKVLVIEELCLNPGMRDIVLATYLNILKKMIVEFRQELSRDGGSLKLDP